jgi:beta-hydroxylase
MWAEIARELVSLKFLAFYAYVGCVSYVHFRGKVRLRFARQLSEHSGLFSPYNCLMYAFSAVPRKAVLEVERFPQLALLRDNWQVIRDEARALFEGGHIDYSAEHQDLAFVAFKKRGWKRFYLKWYDDFMPSAQSLCPKTVELVRRIPDINAAAFTMLPPGTKLGKHRDPFAGSLRYHLGLVTPNSDLCRIWIDGFEYSWRDGEDIVFDETYIHWAENQTDQHRIIFFADVTRPLHTPVARAFSAFMNRWVFWITKSHNVGTDPVGLLNRLTPVVFRLKHFFLAAKSWNRPAYYATKFALVACLVYVVLLRDFLDG